MAIENERKYILDMSIKQIEWLCQNYGGEKQSILQAYINDGRIRKIYNQDTKPQHIFTWKTRRPDGSMIEIETDISKQDFKELWEISTNTIIKNRIKIIDGDVTWDVDFLIKYDITDEDDGKHYLTIAEAEMPEGWDVPDVLPDFVNDNLLFLVPRDKDREWTNKNLSDSKKVKQMLKKTLKDMEKDRD